jgi:hypothetical protein
VARLLAYIVPLFAAGALAVACGPHASSTEPVESVSSALAEDGTDVNEVESQSSALTASFTLAASSAAVLPTATQLVSTDAKANTHSLFIPEGCVTVLPDPTNNQVTYAFNQCTGPWGLVKVSGTIVAHYTDVANGLQIDVGGVQIGTPAEIYLNRAIARYQATATVSGVAGHPLERSMTWSGTLDGTTARGRGFTRSANWTVGWRLGDSTVSLSGSAEGDVAGRVLKTEVTDYVKSRGECPASGEVKITNETKNEFVDLLFNGTNQATFTGVDGQQYQLTLACGL